MARKVTRKEYHKARKQRSVDISQTAWRDKTKKAPGRLTGPKGKLYTGLVNLGEGKGIAVYKEGKRIGWRGKGLTSPKKKKQTTAGGRGGGGSQTAAAAAPSKPKKPKGWKTASRIGGYTPGTRLAGSGSDGVNAATSSGSARTSDYVHDAFSSYWQQPASGSKRYSRPATQNRPTPGARMQLRTDKSGRKRWVKVV